MRPAGRCLQARRWQPGAGQRLARRVLLTVVVGQIFQGADAVMANSSVVARRLRERPGIRVALLDAPHDVADEEVLEKLAEDYPLPKMLLEHRGLSKLKSTYCDKLPAMADAKGFMAFPPLMAGARRHRARSGGPVAGKPVSSAW